MNQITGKYTQISEGEGKVDIEPIDLTRGKENKLAELVGIVLSSQKIVNPGESVRFYLGNLDIRSANRCLVLSVEPVNCHNPYPFQIQGESANRIGSIGENGPYFRVKLLKEKRESQK